MWEGYVMLKSDFSFLFFSIFWILILFISSAFNIRGEVCNKCQYALCYWFEHRLKTVKAATLRQGRGSQQEKRGGSYDACRSTYVLYITIVYVIYIIYRKLEMHCFGFRGADVTRRLTVRYGSFRQYRVKDILLKIYFAHQRLHSASIVRALLGPNITRRIPNKNIMSFDTKYK